MSTSNPETDIAIVGLACRLPGAPNETRYAELLFSGRKALRRFSRDELIAAGVPARSIDHPGYVPVAGTIEGFDGFDAGFFGFSPRDAQMLDPQQRHFLECAWLALENAGLAGRTGALSVGVFGGTDTNTYLLNNIAGDGELRARLGEFAIVMANDKDFLATRTAYKLGFSGPAMSLQTACSTSLVAIGVACQALADFQCDLALVGGASVRVPHHAGYLFEPGGIHSPDGDCRPFEAGAAGTVTSSGVGVLCLQRATDAARDGHRIRALIGGWAINNDGNDKIGYSAPSAKGQAECLRLAQSFAQVEPEDVDYVETHGTGTKLGDAIEIRALTEVFGSRPRSTPLRLGAVKAVLGHCGAAAGVAALIKAVLCLERGEIAAQPQLNASDATLAGVDPNLFQLAGPTSQPWTRTPGRQRIAGISSFGIGGTNAHIILREAPANAAVAPESVARRPYILVTSAKSEQACRANAGAIADFVATSASIDMPATEGTLALRRQALDFRSAGVGASPGSAAEALRAAPAVQATRPAVVFLFPGQGTQAAGMFGALRQSWPAFAGHLDRASAAITKHAGWDPREVIDNGAARSLHLTRYGQPCLFAVEYALGMAFLEILGQPSAMIGHSLGEVTAATLCGVFDLDTAAGLVVNRGELMQECRQGRMLAVGAAPQDIPRLLPGSSICAFNSPLQTVVGGSVADIEAAQALLKAAGVHCTMLPPQHAFHTETMAPAAAQLGLRLENANLRAPQGRIGSCVTGAWLTAEEATQGGYWARQIVSPVRFADMIAMCAELGPCVTIELGPGRALSALAQGQSASNAPMLHHTLAADVNNATALDIARLVGTLWCQGVDVDWSAWGITCRQVVGLPGYSFSRERYWIEASRPHAGPAAHAFSGAPVQPDGRVETPRAGSATVHSRPALATAYCAPTREEEEIVVGFMQEILGLAPVGIDDSFTDLGVHSLAAVRLVGRLSEAFGVQVPVRTIFDSQTVRRLCEAVDALTIATANPDELALAKMESALVPLAPAPEPEATAAAAQTTREPMHRSNPVSRPASSMQLSVFFFAGTQGAAGEGLYKLLLDTAMLADAMGLEAVWVPDRHFHEFGAPYASPSVLASALAVKTTRVKLRAGSVVLPARHPVRVAEEWAMVDNLSDGRVGIALASGFHPIDFVYRPENFADRGERMLSGLADLRRLWSGATLPVVDGNGNSAEIRLFPRPVQTDVPIWLTSAGRSTTFENAAKARTRVLTAPLELDLDELSRRIALYYDTYLTTHGSLDGAGVTVMLHAFMGRTLAEAKDVTREPFQRFLASHSELSKSLLTASGMGAALAGLSESDRQAILDHAFDRFVNGPSLIGDQDKCLRILEQLSRAGVTEIACLVDFGLSFDDVAQSLQRLMHLIPQLPRQPGSTGHV